ncbi:FAD-binding domain-containing protein [Aurantiacibacter marinus]|uniref:DNA photolyase n=1 Tax=Aurantiacibacter marinus TaxID=874156 RepID=A0A0H0XRR8_9SPHN|nr:FAD-binding domain-containing protein [Aurantiacibacter marinus]KLI62965.1 DNA photolyase [Aurantiacibacter marinus]
MQFNPTRSAGLQQLEIFLPLAGGDYAHTRNHDTGPARTNVSQLSPWLHAGLLSEREVIAAALDQHSREDADKFIAEVFWRVYFKGYLEQRPAIWRGFCDGRDAAFEALDSNAGLRKSYAEAVEGRTGIAAFDHWARELAETGYLHNHARMWFASIWIFTLKLDWTLGADFFLRHLMDGDAASNTLSWRWVGGLHTQGKTYLARADNIARYTVGHPAGPLAANGLATEAHPLTESAEYPRIDLDFPDSAMPGAPFALLLHDEGASHSGLDLPHEPAIVIGAARPAARSTGAVGKHALAFANGAVDDGLKAAAAAYGCPIADWQGDQALPDLLAQSKVEHLITPFLPTGWTRDALWPELVALQKRGLLSQQVSDLDRLTWPYARAGFFRVKKEIDSVLADIGLPTR